MLVFVLGGEGGVGVDNVFVCWCVEREEGGGGGGRCTFDLEC